MTRGEKSRQFIPSVESEPKAEGATIAAVAFAPDSKTFASAWVSYRHEPMYVQSVGHGISLWETATGKERRLDGRAFDAGVSRRRQDARRRGWTTTWARSARDSDKGTLQFWDIATGKKRRAFEGPGEWGGVLAFSPDGKRFASAGGSGDPSVYLWSTATGRQIHRFHGHRRDVHGLAFSPDGHMLASGSGDTTILLWEVLGLER